MSARLGAAMAASVRQAMRTPGAKYFLVEGVPLSLAEGMSRAWDAELPPLAVVSSEPGRFGEHALAGVSGTALRNGRGEAGPRGVVLVLCEGEQVPDRQSLGLFQPLLPSALLQDAGGMGLLAQQQPRVALDGPARAVREAVQSARPAARPSAVAVAEWMDRVASGENALRALPVLGAFADPAGGERVDAERILENLALASRRTGEDIMRPGSYPDVRARAMRVLARRSDLVSDQTACAAAVDEVMRAVQSGDERLLRLLAFDEAREVLEKATSDVATMVATALRDYRLGLDPKSSTFELPWDHYLKMTPDLKRRADQRPAAGALLELDESQQRRLFPKPLRRKLEGLMRDKSLNASDPSSPEAGLVRATEQLGERIQRVEVLSPRPSATKSANRTGAGQMLTLACARLRLGHLMREWDSLDGEIDGLLLRPPGEGDLAGAFNDAELVSRSALPPLQLKLHGYKGSVQLDWKPDLDDVAWLRAALLFAEQPALTLQMPAEPSLRAFCGGRAATAIPVESASLQALAAGLHRLAQGLLTEGASPGLLQVWVDAWRLACEQAQEADDTTAAGALAAAGGVLGDEGAVALTALAPMKAEWLAQYLQAMRTLLDEADASDTETRPASTTAGAAARSTASQHPAYLWVTHRDQVLVPTSEGRVWGVYGGRSARDESGYAAEALGSVLERLLTLQPEAAGHLRCLAWGPGAADALAAQALKVIGSRVGAGRVNKVEIFCVGRAPEDRPDAATLAEADEKLRGSRDVLELRYLDSLEEARQVLPTAGGAPAVHLALVTGLSDGGSRLHLNTQQVQPPAPGTEVLFAPRTWQRPRVKNRTLLMPPAATPAGLAWLRVQHAVAEEWPQPGEAFGIPELKTGAMDLAPQLKQVHDLALWVATLDRYATRDSLEHAMGAEEVAILHQERRLGGDSPLALVLSQKSGGPADRAIGRSLRAAGIVADPRVAFDIGTDIRKVASQGYGILALQAATSGAGINELVGHCVAFSLLARKTTPWPLPPNCRVLLVSLDEYRQWFRSQRADLLAIALDTQDVGVHVAAIEVKARRSDEFDAANKALDQLNQTLTATRWAAYPEEGSVHSRMWLNRLAEAAYSVARESGFKLSAEEIGALEAFRLGRGSLEWAGVGLVFGPQVEESHRDFQREVSGDIVPVAMHNIRLTEQLLRDATQVQLTELRTVEADARPLLGGRQRRRPEARATAETSEADGEGRTPAVATQPAPAGPSAQETAAQMPPGLDDPADVAEAAVDEPAPPASSWEGPPERGVVSPGPALNGLPNTGQTEEEAAAATEAPAQATAPGDVPGGTSLGFQAPVLGWDAMSGEEVRWHPAGSDQGVLQNGHAEVWGSSGMGKTQFLMSLLAQLSHHSGSRFGIADFKNDYSPEVGFPRYAGATFVDLWNEGAEYNPLALHDRNPRAIDTAVIQIRDTIDEAAQTVGARMGIRQKRKLNDFLERAYSSTADEDRWPTLKTLNSLLDDDLDAVLGDLTRHGLFQDGPPLGDVVSENVVFGLSRIPGNGQTTALAAGFILSSLLLKMQDMPPVPNTIRYVAVVDEAHRVSSFNAVKTMLREGRSKGLAVLLATQGPTDLAAEVAANAQTKICFGLPDATVASMAARKLDPDDPRLTERIRTLDRGEALVKFAGQTPRLLRMAQAYRDSASLGLPGLHAT